MTDTQQKNRQWNEIIVAYLTYILDIFQQRHVVRICVNLSNFMSNTDRTVSQ